jgi:hypothetical protein
MKPSLKVCPRMEFLYHPPTSATANRLGATAVARDAAGGVGGARERIAQVRSLFSST